VEMSDSPPSSLESFVLGTDNMVMGLAVGEF
jgi:hypothetical protein